MAFFNNRYESGERGNWKFRYSGAELSQSLKARMKHHTERASYWHEEARTTEEKLRSDGIRLQEFGVTGGTRFEAKIDSSLGSRLSEAREASKIHDRFVEQYEAFEHQFEKEPERIYELALEDLRFFGIVGEAATDDDR